MLDLYLVFTEKLDALGIRYMVSGSVAAMFYGEPRLTNDVDIVLWVPAAKVPSLVNAFPLDTFYCPPEEVILDEINRSKRGHGNIIHHETGFKADLYFVKNDPLHLWGLSHVKIAEFDGDSFKIAPPEYVVIRKLEFYPIRKVDQKSTCTMCELCC